VAACGFLREMATFESAGVSGREAESGMGVSPMPENPRAGRPCHL
jgi:hypothetical protein